MNSRALIVSLHDVSPHTHTACLEILEQLAVPCTSLLVIPDHHSRGHFLEHPEFCSWMRGAAAAGHEIVMHGYLHRRTRRSNERLKEKLTTRVYTADEGEFFDLDRAAAAELVRKSRAEFHKAGVQPHGFIAPAWLLGSEAEQGLRDAGCSYTTRLGSVLDLESGTSHQSQSLVWSVRAAWRRQLSLAWNALLFRRLRGNPLLRISVHPVDLQHPRIWRQIRQLIRRALVDRQPLTYHAWLTGQQPSTPQPAPIP